jgi:platelet-activating factor acetylhydrolase IB subunit beta/gamma
LRRRVCHGGVEGLEPKVVVLLIGNNNMFFTAETGVDAAAQGIKMCIANILLDLTADLLNPDGTVRAELFTPDKIHLTQEAGYGLFAEKLKPSLEKVLSK